MKATGTFAFESFVADPPYLAPEPLAFSRAHIAKTFKGDIVGTATVEMLALRNGKTPSAYVALEHLQVSLHGRAGAFALVHRGLASATGLAGEWLIAHESGSGQLAGISGTGVIDIAPDGTHHLTLNYELPSAPPHVD